MPARISSVLALVAIAAVGPDVFAQGFGPDALAGSEVTTQLGGSLSQVGGDTSPAGGCPAYATTPDLWFNAALETAYADGDPVEPPTNFGSNGDSFDTPNTASSPTMQIPCDSGSGFSCFYFDGGDQFRDADGSLSAYKFLHDGTGATCLVVTEHPGSAAAETWFSTNNGTSAAVGVNHSRNGVLVRDQFDVTNGTGGQLPVSVTDSNTDDEIHVLVFSHGTSRTPDAEVRFDQNQDLSANYSFTPSTADHAGRLTIGRRPNSVSPLTGYIHEFACWSSTMSTSELEALEAVAACNWTADGSFPE